MVDGMLVQGMGSDSFDYDNEVPTMHYSEVDSMDSKKDTKQFDRCPDCEKLSIRAKTLAEGGGVVCTNPDCDYWFCY